jgi:uncharacterized Tic20 family protein
MSFVQLIATIIHIILCISLWLALVVTLCAFFSWFINKLLSRTHLEEDTRHIISFLLSIAITVGVTTVIIQRNGFFLNK